MPGRPSWNELFEIAARQEGIFSVDQAAIAGYSRQLLAHHIRWGRVVRLRRGVYGLTDFRSGAFTPFVEVWLWSGRRGIFSHRSALGLHGLADLASWPIHLTVPAAWRVRRLRVPAGVVLHHAEVPSWERTWRGPVPVTTPRRTLEEVGLFMPAEIRDVLGRGRKGGVLSPRDLDHLERRLSCAEKLLR